MENVEKPKQKYAAYVKKWHRQHLRTVSCCTKKATADEFERLCSVAGSNMNEVIQDYVNRCCAAGRIIGDPAEREQRRKSRGSWSQI